MQIHVFETFNLDLKACFTWKNGVHIGYRAKDSYYMSLYRVNDFYVEIQYHACYDGIASIQTFICEDDLHVYLEQVDLDNLLQ